MQDDAGASGAAGGGAGDDEEAEKEGINQGGDDENHNNMNQLKVEVLDVDIIEKVDDVQVPIYMAEGELTEAAEAYVEEERRCARIRHPIRLGDGLDDQDMIDLFVFLRAHPTRW